MRHAGADIESRVTHANESKPEALSVLQMICYRDFNLRVNGILWENIGFAKAMYVFYIDDSRDQGTSVFSALGIPMSDWKRAFKSVVDFRIDLKRLHSIPFTMELHATAFMGGRGGNIRHVGKFQRSKIFNGMLTLVASLPGAKLLNACAATKDEVRLFERLLNRISTCMRKMGGTAVVVCDQGKESAYTRLARQLAKINHIPSRFGCWPDGSTTRNIPTEFIVEDLIFRVSADSRFVQLSDFCAYALLRSERPIPSKTKYGLDKSFDLLKPICVRAACKDDPRNLGIIRV